MRPDESKGLDASGGGCRSSIRSIRVPGLPSQARRPAAPHAGDSAKKEKHMKEIRDGPHVALVRVHGHVDRKAAMDAAREIAKEVGHARGSVGAPREAAHRSHHAG